MLYKIDNNECTVFIFMCPLYQHLLFILIQSGSRRSKAWRDSFPSCIINLYHYCFFSNIQQFQLPIVETNKRLRYVIFKCSESYIYSSKNHFYRLAISFRERLHRYLIQLSTIYPVYIWYYWILGIILRIHLSVCFMILLEIITCLESCISI